jgi:membrane-associated phospholipid phosphatase
MPLRIYRPLTVVLRLALLLPFMCQAQIVTDTLVLTMAPIRKHSFIAEAVVPAALIGTGILINRTNLEKTVNKETEGMFKKNFNTTADDYLRFAPIAQMYIADAVGIKAKNHWFDQTKNLAISMVVTDFIVHQIKKATSKTRPNGAELAHSFPSAHTALANVSATVLYEEFRESSPLLAYSGFGFSTATGTLRLLNNAHWVSAGHKSGVFARPHYSVEPL